MATINTAFDIVAGALDADQSALSIVANNVANANTTGYTREVPNWRENAPLTVNGVSYGDGVTQTGPTSVRDNVLQQRLDQQQQLASSSSARLGALNLVQALFTPNSGSTSATAGDIGSDITNFFSSFASLEANPTDDALRQNVLSTAQSLAGDISNAASSLNSQQQAVDQEAAGVTSQVNALTTSIAQLDQQIQSLTTNGDAGALEDQRQQDISQLSQLIGINQVPTDGNGLSITTTSGRILVSDNESFALTTGTVSGLTHFYLGTTDVTAELASGGGQLGGYLIARDQDIPNALAELDQLANGISTSVNDQNNLGTDLNGAEGTGTNAAGVTGTGTAPLYIFNEPTQVQGSALAMSVVMTDPSDIAAAAFGNGTGDDSNAVALANLGNQPLTVINPTSSFGLTQNLSSATSSTPPGNTVTGSEQVYDSLGNTHQLTVTYANQGGGQWTYAITLADQLQTNTSVAGQVSYAFGPGETVDPGTNLTISGLTSFGAPATITAPTITSGETVGNAASGYVNALDSALTAAGIVGVTVTNTNGVLTIAGASATSGNVIANPVPSANASGTLQFNASGNLTSPSADVSGITFSGLSGGAAAMTLEWDLYGANGASNITQTAAVSGQTAQTQNGSVVTAQNPTDFYSNFLSQLGSTVSEVEAENTTQNASVTQLQTQQNALSAVNLNDEATYMQQFERSYQAASEVFTILNTVMASALNLGVQTAVA